MIWERKEQNALKNWLENRQESIWKPWEVDIPLAGYHQSINAVIAFTALMKIRSFADKINDKSISDGLAKIFWPCRFEKVSIDPPVILDGAHNPDSIEKLVMTLNRFYGTKRITCVFGCSEDKDLSGMIRILAPFVSDFIVTRSTHPRSMETKQIYDEVLSNGRPAVIRESLELALRDIDNGDKNNVYIVTGSLFVTAGIRELLMKRNPDMKYFEKKK
jgi:dihydrofolate synthase/folylpolyglutamate synthase